MQRNKSKKLIWLIPVCVLIALALGFTVYAEQYYHADASALDALMSDETVSVKQTDQGWFFDGSSETDALIFYPGARVEETAYVPLMHLLAKDGLDVFIVKMPFRLAVFGENKADTILSAYDYANWYIGGHSLGGAVAANYAAHHGSQLSGAVFLAAYPTNNLDSDLTVITVYGSEDEVLNMTKLEEGKTYLPESSVTYVIEGGNHAQFGNYGAQSGDGNSTISPDEQQRQTAELIMKSIK